MDPYAFFEPRPYTVASVVRAHGTRKKKLTEKWRPNDRQNYRTIRRHACMHALLSGCSRVIARSCSYSQFLPFFFSWYRFNFQQESGISPHLAGRGSIGASLSPTETAVGTEKKKLKRTKKRRDDKIFFLRRRGEQALHIPKKPRRTQAEKRKKRWRRRRTPEELTTTLRHRALPLAPPPSPPTLAHRPCCMSPPPPTQRPSRFPETAGHQLCDRLAEITTKGVFPAHNFRIGREVTSRGV